MSYCIYLRKSRADIEAEALGEGETLTRHERILLALAKKLKINITKIYREIVSGETISDRPEMQELLSDVEKNIWKGVLVMEIERLARGDTIDQGIVAQTFKYSGTKIITPMKTYNPNDEFDEEYFEFGLFMSRREYKTINRRLQRGRLQAAKEGKYVGNIPPYGYNRKKLTDQKGYTLEPHPNESNVVRLIYELYTGTERLGVSRIQNKLNEMKVPTRKGGDWTTSTIRDILINPVYIGKIRWNWRQQVKKIVNGVVIKKRPRADKEDWILADGLHEPIIDEMTFHLAQKYMAKNATLPVPTRYKVKNPLAGLIVCSICGRKMNRKSYKGDYPDTLICVGPTCPNVSSHLYLVEERLLQALEKWLRNYMIEIGEQEERNANIEVDIIRQSIDCLDEEIKTLNKQLDNLHNLLEQGVYSIEIFMERSKILNSTIKTTRDNKKKLENRLKNIFSINEKKKNIIPQVKKVIEIYWKLTTSKDKNELLKEVLEKAVYTKEEGGRWSGKVDGFELKIYPKLPK